MKVPLILFALLFSFSLVAKDISELLSFSSFAEDISDFEIEGMSIGDSLLDYLSIKEIHNNIVKDGKKFIQIFLLSEIYNSITIMYMKNDNKYLIHEISGRTSYANISDCYKEQKKITNSISQILDNISDKDDRGKKKYRGDETNESTISIVNFYLYSGGVIHTGCYDFSDSFSKINNVPDFMNISLGSEEFMIWQKEEAFK